MLYDFFIVVFIFFFFKQKTAYEMRISDWSSDVCSSDLRVRLEDGRWLNAEAVILANGIQATELCPELPIEAKKGHLLITDRYPATVCHTLVELGYVTRSEERRVGKECVSTCRSRWWPIH